MTPRSALQGEQHLSGRQPNSSHCFVCGLENPSGLQMVFYNVGQGQVEARYTVPREFEGYPGVVHGGIVASMLDEVVGRVAMTDDPNRFLVTAKLELRYRAPVPIEEELRIFGEKVQERSRFTEAKGWIQLPDGQVGAEAHALLADRPGGEVDQETLDELGWKVYPE